MDLLKQVYPALLDLIGMQVTSDGFIRAEIAPGDFIQATLKGKMLVIPTYAQLTSADVENKEPFHPFYENQLEGESPQAAQYRHQLIAITNRKIGALAIDLLTLAGDEARHPQLRPDQQEFLKLVPLVEKRTIDDFKKIFELVKKPNQLQHTFYTIHTTKAMEVNGKSYQMAAKVSFPFYEEITEMIESNASAAAAKRTKTKKDKEVWGVELRGKDREIYKGLMEILIPEADQPLKHAYGSNSNIAARIDALLHSFMKIAGHLNGICDLFTGVIKDIETMKFNSDWVEGINSLESLWTQIREIPRPGSVVTETPPAVAAAAPAPAAAPARVTASQLLQQVNSPQAQAGRPLPWEAVSGNPYGGGVAPSVVAPAVVNRGGQHSFSDLMRANPGLAQSAAQQMQPMQQAQPVYGQPAYGQPAPAPYGNNQGRMTRRY